MYSYTKIIGKKMNNLYYIVALLMIATLAVAIIGFVQIMFKSKNSDKRSNKMMILRVVLQAIVIALIAIIYINLD